MDDDTQRVVVTPALDPATAELVSGLAGVGRGPRRLWPGQPGRRSPWLPCASGCCLSVEERPSRRPGDDPAAWLRFLVREVLAPRAAAPRQRARQLGLPGGHRLDGRVLLDPEGRRPRLVVVSSNRVRVIDLDGDLFPVEPDRPRRRQRRGPGEVVPIEPRGRRRASAPRSPPS